MSSFLTFSSDKVLSSKDGTGTAVVKTLIVLMLFGGLVFLVSLTWLLPIDLFSSALWYDNLNMSLVWGEASGLFDKLSFATLPRSVSIEGTGFALFLFFAQIALAIEAARQGSWSLGEDGVSFFGLIGGLRKETIDIDDINWAKFGYIFLMIIIGLFDTYTDSQWKSSSGTIGPAKAYVTSFFFNNVGSEWLLFWGFGSALEAISGAIGFSGLVKDTKSAKQFKPRKPQSSGKKQQRNKKSTGGPPKPPNAPTPRLPSSPNLPTNGPASLQELLQDLGD